MKKVMASMVPVPAPPTVPNKWFYGAVWVSFVIWMLVVWVLGGNPAMGQTPAGSTVTLNWTISPSIPPTGQTIQYNIYRAPGTCPPAITLTGATKVNSSPITGLVYVDKGVAVGTYCYIGTAFLVSTGAESGPSAWANAVVGLLPMQNFQITVQVALDPNTGQVSVLAVGAKQVGTSSSQQLVQP